LAFQIVEPLSKTALAPGESATIVVGPKTGLRQGTYSGVLFVYERYEKSVNIPLSFEVLPKYTYSAKVTPTVKTFLSKKEGYTSKAAQTFTITNTGTGKLYPKTAHLASWSLPFAEEYFEWEPGARDLPYSLEPGESMTTSWRPKLGLPASDTPYTDTLIIEYREGQRLYVPLSFTVTPP